MSDQAARRSRLGSLALGGVVIGALTAGCGGSSAPASVRSHSGGQGSGPVSCPSAPLHPRITHGDTEQSALPPPALDDVHNGRFVAALMLDNALRVTPPRSGDEAAYPGSSALCEVLAATNANGLDVGRQSPDTIAFGLARVTVPDRLLHQSTLGPGVVSSGSVDGLTDKNPTTPPPQPYRDRLAWVAVIAPTISSSCPIQVTGQSAPPRHDEPGHHGYQVFLVDAATGGAALIYTERHNGICPGSRAQGPYVDVPLTSVSLPWTLVSEQPDRSSAQIGSTVTPCDGYSAVIFADSPDPHAVTVVVQRPFGPACGPPKHIVEKLRLGRIGEPLPPHLRHGRVGPYIP